MSGKPDITVTLTFHHEGAFALSAIDSLNDLVATARKAGIAVETLAILDRADALTKHIVDVRGRWIDGVKEVSFGDPALSRNAATQLAHGRFLSFLDGDDLWGEQWLKSAFNAANNAADSTDLIWHPEQLYVFQDCAPGEPRDSFYSLMQSSEAPEFSPVLLLYYSLWSANAFASRDVHLRFPYRCADVSHGLGIGDWSWNLATFAAGIHHRIVPGTVHLIRKKQSGSVEQANAAIGLLPYLPSLLHDSNIFP